MSIKFSLKLLDSDSQIKMEILSALKVLLDKALIKLANRIEPKIRILLRQALRNEPEYVSLTNGVLRKEFGIADISNVDIAIDNIVNSMDLSIQSVSIKSSKVSGGISLSIVPNNLSGIIDDTSAFVIDSERGYSLPWLEWLLTKGGSIIVRGFEVQYGPNPRSRSGDAIMISSSSNWRVPSEFSGTPKNNWITRALSTIETKIIKVLEDELRAIL